MTASSAKRKRKTGRAPAAKTSLRTEAIEAQKSRDLSVDKLTAQDDLVASKVVSSLRSGVSGVQLNPICAILDSHRFLCRWRMTWSTLIKYSISQAETKIYMGLDSFLRYSMRKSQWNWVFITMMVVYLRNGIYSSFLTALWTGGMGSSAQHGFEISYTKLAPFCYKFSSHRVQRSRSGIYRRS